MLPHPTTHQPLGDMGSCPKPKLLGGVGSVPGFEAGRGERSYKCPPVAAGVSVFVRAVCLGLPEVSVPDGHPAWAGAVGVADAGYSTVTVTAWASSTHRLGWSFRQVCVEVRGRAELGLSLAFAQHLSISSLSCQRRCPFGLSKHYGVGGWLFSKKGKKNSSF